MASCPRLAPAPGAATATLCAAHVAPRPSPHRTRPPRTRLSVQAGTRMVEVDGGDGGAFVLAPTKQRPCGIVHFLGGAFVASVPHLTYPLLLHRLAEGGYTVVATPYAVTFQHVECARKVQAAFEEALEKLRCGGSAGGGRRGGLGAWAVPTDVPVHGVGHSNGALLHMLIGSVCLPEEAAAAATAAGTPRVAVSGAAPTNRFASKVDPTAGINQSQSLRPSSSSLSSSTHSSGGSSNGGGTGSSGGSCRASNVLISYNNKQVGEAVPVPLGALQPAVQQLRGQGRLAAAAQQGLQQAAATAQQLLRLADAVGPMRPAGAEAARWRQQQRELLSSLQQLDPALVQLGSVFDEVGDGFQDFTPSPAESRQLISSRYSVPSTLLIQFTDDNTDESPEAEAMLRSSGNSSGSRGSARSSGRTGGSISSGSGSGLVAGGNGSFAAPSSAPDPSLQRTVRRLVLPGTHVTPCGAELARALPRGARFGPAEALAMAASKAIQADTHRMADRVLEFLDSHS